MEPTRNSGDSNGRYGDNYIRGADGRPLRDRYGRPIRRRPRAQQPSALTPDEMARRQRLQRPSPRANETMFLPTADAAQRPKRDQNWDRDYHNLNSEPPHAQPPRTEPPRSESRQPNQRMPRQRTPRSQMPRGRRRWPKVRIRTIILLLVLVLVGTMALVDVRLNRVEAFSPLTNRPSWSVASNWLLVGSDSRAGLTEEDAARLSTGSGDFGQRTDTIMIAHIPVVGKPKLVSIPRDSYVDIPGFGQNKINAAFSLGGAPLLIQTIEQATNVRIDHYAEVGFGGFAGLVDAVGGIELCPTEAIDDPLAGLNIQAGCQEFDGKSGLGYVRTRATAQGDLDRVQRQREFMSALVSKITSPWTLINPFRMIPLLNAGTKTVTVGDGDHVWHMTWLMLRMALGSESLTVPTGGAMDAGDAGNVLLWDDAAAQELFKQLK